MRWRAGPGVRCKCPKDAERLEASFRPRPLRSLISVGRHQAGKPRLCQFTLGPAYIKGAAPVGPAPPPWPLPPNLGPAPSKPRLPLRLPPAGAWALHPAAAENRGGCKAGSTGGQRGAAQLSGGRCPREPPSPPLPAPRPYPLGVCHPPGTGPRLPPGPRGGVLGQHLPRLAEPPWLTETPPCLDPRPTSG